MGGAAAALDYDAELMLRVRDGDAASFDALLGRHRSPLVHYLYRMVQNHGAAEDLAQEVFLRVYRSRETYEATAKFRTWLFRIATRTALNWLRTGGRDRAHDSIDASSPDGAVRDVPDQRPSIEQDLVDDCRVREIRGAIAALPEKQRAAVLMHKYEAMEYAQIAQVLGCSEAAVKSLLFRAYESLRARLAHMNEGQKGR
jgi:RNA polymerase sigma-70 factor (ECF subfamily)